VRGRTSSRAEDSKVHVQFFDCRSSPTAVNEPANAKPMEWFGSNLVSTVLWCPRGAGRRVYPGLLQFAAL
jgi:poly(3-hydroxybutyrate) depolymerase